MNLQSQPPDRNNPANPLLKVAGLQIDKEQDLKKPAQSKVVINLTFKQSADLRGHMKGRDDRRLTISFGLALKRASLKLVFANDRGVSPTKLVKIKKVAFAEPLSRRQHISEKEDVSRERAMEAAIGARAEVNPTEVVPAKMAAAGSGKAIIGGASKKRQHKTIENSSINIKATYGGNQIHWEIYPAETILPDAEPYLTGEVFRTSSVGSIPEACLVVRQDGEPASSMVVRGSVFVSMADMHITNVIFSDEIGAPVGLSEVEPSSPIWKNTLNRTETKHRILKQVIRKHLLDQGMELDGPYVEICRAES